MCSKLSPLPLPPQTAASPLTRLMIRSVCALRFRYKTFDGKTYDGKCSFFGISEGEEVSIGELRRQRRMRARAVSH